VPLAALQGDLRRAGDAANRLVAFPRTASNLGVLGTVRGAQGDTASAIRTSRKGWPSTRASRPLLVALDAVD
jgi:hypothetical protein